MSEAQPRHPDNAVDTPESYAHASKRPLAVLVILLPLIAFYELAAVVVLDEVSGRSWLTSRNLIHTLFEVFGVIGVHLPAVLLLATLIAQHLIARDPLRLSPRVPVIMVGESIVWAMPIVVFAGIMGLLPLDGTRPAGPPLEAAAVAVGAGVYEEFVFRLALIAAVHALLVDLCGAKERLGRTLALLASAFAFASYHGIEVGGAIDPAAAVFFGLSGLFLGWLFLNRGLGIAAGAHVVYDLLILVAIPALARG